MRLKDKLIEWGDAFYYQSLARHLRGMRRVLDLGCGSRSPLAKVKSDFYSVGMDIFELSIEKSRKRGIHDEYVTGDVTQIDSVFDENSFDAVIALDLIEHLKKGQGEKLLTKMERIAKKKVIVFTPRGFYKQEPYENNPYQVHLSGWEVEDFRKRGYRVYGMRGFGFLRGEYASLKYRPWLLWGSVCTVAQYPLYFFPNFSYQILAIKNLDDDER